MYYDDCDQFIDEVTGCLIRWHDWDDGKFFIPDGDWDDECFDEEGDQDGDVRFYGKDETGKLVNHYIDYLSKTGWIILQHGVSDELVDYINSNFKVLKELKDRNELLESDILV